MAPVELALFTVMKIDTIQMKRNKVDLQGDRSYQYTWVPMLQAASGCIPAANSAEAATGSRPASVSLGGETIAKPVARDKANALVLSKAGKV